MTNMKTIKVKFLDFWPSFNVNDNFIINRLKKYANVVFDHQIYENREIVRDYLMSLGIEPIGRFGEWGYLWSNQSLLSGMNAIK